MEEPLPGTPTLTLDPGDFAWALGSSDLWWPARVRSAADAPPKAACDRPDDPTSLYLTCFADGPSGFYSPDRLTPFETAFARLTAQSPSRALARAVAAASDAYARCTEAELTCACAPAAAGRDRGRRSRRIAEAVAGAVPGEVLTSVREAAVDVCARSALEVAEMRGWIAAFARSVQGRCVPLAEFSVYRGLPQVREKVGDLNVDGGVFGFGEVSEVCEDEGKKQRSMAELIAGLDLGGCDGDGDEVEEADANVVGVAKAAKRRVKKGTGFGNAEDAGTEELLGSGRRERKKSKYLSPPYTLVSLKGKRAKKAGSWEDDSDADGEEVVGRNSRSRSGASQREDVYWDVSGYVLDEKTSPVDVLLMELHLVALDVTYLLGSQLNHDVRGLFGRYRCETYKGSAKVEADIDDIGAANEGETVMGDGGVVVGEVGSMEKVRTPLVDGSGLGVKRRGYTKKKSIGGIIRSGTGDIESSRPDEGGPDGDISTQKRRRKKERMCGDGEIPQTVTAGEEVNGTEGGKPAKRKYRKREKKDEVCGDGEILQSVTAGEEMNGTEGGKPAKRKYRKREKKEEANVDVGVGVSPAMNVLEANGSEEGKSEKKRRGRKKKEAILDGVNSKETGGKRKDQANGEMGYVVGVPVTLVPNGSEQVNKEGGGMPEMNAGMTNTEVRSTPMVLGASGTGEFELSESANRKMKTASVIDFGVSQLVVGVGDNGASKPKQKRQRKKEATASVESGVAPVAAASEGVADNAMPKQKRSRKKKEASGSNQGATLMISFAKDAQLPSREELITTYSKFGMLSESGTELMEDTSSASVVFTKKSDAKKAFNSANKDRVLGSSSIAACELRHVLENSSAPPSIPAALPALTPKPTLEDVKKNLESMISTLTASGVNARDFLGSDGGMPSELKENLVDEMSGLLRKVNSFFVGSPSSAGGSAVGKGGAAS